MENTQTNTRYLTDSMEGAPKLSATWGDLVKLLKIVLVDGFNEKAVQSVTLEEGTSNVILTYSSAHGYITPQVISIIGSDDPNLNGFHRVIFSDTNTLKIKPKTTVTVLTGTITTKVAPLGYDLVFNDIAANGVACFKNKDNSQPYILKVIDKVPPNGYDPNWFRYARVVAGSEIDSTGNFINNEKFPRHPIYPDMEKTGNGVSGAGGVHGLMKWDYVSYRTTSYNAAEVDTSSYGNYPTSWRIIGDNKTFYLFIKPMGAYYSQYNILSFGSINGDVANCVLTGSQREITSNSNYNGKSGVAWRMGFTHSAHNVGNFIYKTSSGGYNPWLNFSLVGLYTDEGQRNWPSRGGINTANPLTGKIFTTPLFIRDALGDYRGTLRGIEQFYGIGKLTDKMYLNNMKNIVLTTKMFNWDWDSDEANPYLFSLEDW